MGIPLKVLILEDRRADLQLILYELRQAGFDPLWTCVDCEQDFADQLRTIPDLILSDFSLPAFDALRALEVMQDAGLDLPFVVVSGSIGEDVAVDAMRRGATDYLLKDRLGRLGTAVHNALEQFRLRKEKMIAVEAHRSATTLFQNLVENSLVGIQILMDGKYIFANSKVAEMFGYTESELLALRSWEEVVADSDRDKVKNQVKRRLSGEQPQAHYTFRGLRKDQTVIDIEVRSTRIEVHGQPAVLGMLVDITDRKRAEADMQRTSDLLRAVAESTPDAMFVKDRDGKYLLFNPAAARFVGRTIEDVLGRDDSELFEPDSARIVQERDRQVMESGHLETAEESLSSGGISRTFLATKGPYRDSLGNVIGVIGISRDITDRKRAENEIRLRDRAIQAVTQGILITDPSLPDNPIMYVSPSFEQLTGYSAQEVVGRNCRFLQGPGTDPEAVARIREAIQAGQPCKVEILNYRRDGSSFWNELAISPVRDENGTVTHFVGSQADVTVRRKLEEQLRQVQKMEAVGRLAGGVAHDFNNLLTVINGYSELIMDSLVPDSPLYEFVEQIQKAGERAANLTRRLLAFSRKQMLQPVVLDLNLLISDMETMLRRLVGEDVRFIFNLNDKLSSINADRGQMEQVILNLVVNARDAMPSGGTLIVETKNIDFDPTFASAQHDRRSGSYVLLMVCDSGCGMDKETMARIFEPFFTTKDAEKGTGLGLSTVYGIVNQSNGHIDVYSEPGLGTTFKIYLPASRALAGHSSQMPQPAVNLRGTERILLVEDEAGVRTLAAQILRSQGYEIVEAANGLEALRHIRANSKIFPLVITDVVMPIMGGRQLIEEIRKTSPDCKVLFISGYTEDAVVRHGIMSSEADFLQKPFSASALSMKVREVLDANPATSRRSMGMPPEERL